MPTILSRRPGVCLTAALLMLPGLALAHAGEGLPHDHGLSAGFLHPFTGLDHLAAMLAVGLWSALTQQGRRMLVAPLAFAGWLLMGALAGVAMAQAGMPAAASLVEPMVAASVLVLGLVAAARWTLAPLASIALVGAFAVFHGLAHGAELQGLQALIGMVGATWVLHAVGMGLGLTLRRLAPQWSRLAGASVALLGLGLLTRMVWA